MIRALALTAFIVADAAQAQDVVLDVRAVAACFDGAASADVAPDCVGAAAGMCMEITEGGFSTVGMSTCMAAETDVWDGLLNREHQALRAQMRDADNAEFAGDISRADALRDAQRAWIAYRDAECNFNWVMFQEGTIRSLIAASCLQDMTARRALELRVYWETPQ